MKDKIVKHFYKIYWWIIGADTCHTLKGNHTCKRRRFHLGLCHTSNKEFFWKKSEADYRI